MDYFVQETKRERTRTAAAWALLTLVSGVVAYYELINHRAIAGGGPMGWIAHASLFASLTICMLGVASSLQSIGFIYPSMAVLAVALEAAELVPTIPGSVFHGLCSVIGIGIVWLGVRLLGRPRQDTAMAIAVLLWALGLICASQGTIGGDPDAVSANPAGAVARA